MDSTLFSNPFQVVYMNFATKNLLACLCAALSTVETVSMIFIHLIIIDNDPVIFSINKNNQLLAVSS